MPSSRYEQITTIMEVIMSLKPKALLDIGAGFGKYGVLAREYLELWDERYEHHKSTWRHTIDGIEGDASYITPVHEYVYNHIYVGDATEIVPTLQGPYNLVLMIDVFEHIEREAGKKLVRDLLNISDGILICVPAEYNEQDAIFNNPFEMHRTHWTDDDLSSMASARFIRQVPKKRMCLLGEKAVSKWDRYTAARSRQWVKEVFPALVPIYRRWIKRSDGNPS
jgi:hypothetical protein